MAVLRDFENCKKLKKHQIKNNPPHIPATQQTNKQISIQSCDACGRNNDGGKCPQPGLHMDPCGSMGTGSSIAARRRGSRPARHLLCITCKIHTLH